jgi:hypothetical protein
MSWGINVYKVDEDAKGCKDETWLGGVVGWRGYGGFCDGHEATKVESDGESRILHGWFYRPVPKSSSAGEITATKTEMSVACEMELVFWPDPVELTIWLSA